LKQLLSLLIIAMVSVLSACTDQTQPVLKVGSNQWSGYEPMFLARDLGYYDDNKVKLVELPSSSETLDLLHEGMLDAGALTLDECVLAASEGTALTLVLVFDLSDGADVVMAGPDIHALADIKGKRVGVETSAVGAMMLSGALDAAGLQDDDIRVVYLTVDEHVSAFEQGVVDAVVTFEPAKTRLQMHGAHVLFDSSQLAGRIIDVLAVRTSVLEQQADHLRMLLAGYMQARMFMAENPDKAAVLMAPRLALTPQEMLASFDGLRLPDEQSNEQWFSGSPAALMQRVRSLEKMMLDKGLLASSAASRLMLTHRFLTGTEP